MNLPSASYSRLQTVKELSHSCAVGYLTHLAREQTTQQLVVIQTFQGNPSTLKSYEQEIAFLASLNHPGIPRYLKTCQTPTGFSLVYEYREAQSLLETLSLSPEAIKQIAMGLLEILVYLQRQTRPIVLRNLNPETIAIDQQFGVSLIDFAAVQIGDRELTPVKITSLTNRSGFTPPEVIYNRQPTQATDLYSLGAILISLVTQTPANKLKRLIEHDTISFAELVSDGFSQPFIQWLEKLVEANDIDRYTCAAAALEALQSIEIGSTSASQWSIDNLDSAPIDEEQVKQALDRACQGLNLYFQIIQQASCLYIFINRESNSQLDYAALTDTIRSSVAALALAPINSLVLYSRSLGAVDPDWETVVELSPPKQPKSAEADNATPQAPIAEPTSPSSEESSAAEKQVTWSEQSEVEQGDSRFSQYCFIRNTTLLTTKIVPPPEKIAQLTETLHGFSPTEKLQILPLLDRHFKSSEATPSDLSDEMQQWLEQITQLNTEETRKAAIWLSRYCFNPEATMFRVKQILHPEAAIEEAAKKSQTAQTAGDSSYPPESATQPQPLEAERAEQDLPIEDTKASSQKAPSWLRLALPIGWLLFTLVAIVLGIRSASSPYELNEVQWSTDSLTQTLGIYGIFISLTTGTLFTAISLFAAATFSKGIRIKSIAAVYKGALLLGMIEAFLSLIPFVNFVLILAVDVFALTTAAKFIKYLTVSRYAGYQVVAIGALVFIVVRVILHWVLLGLIASFVY